MFLLFFEHKVQIHNNKFLVIFLSSITMLLCMSFPIQLDIGFIFDLRYVPFVLAALFGGYKTALPLFIMLNAYRFLIGGDGAFLSLAFSTIIFFIVPLFHEKFVKLESRNRIFAASFATFSTMVFYLFTLSFFFPELNTEFWIITINALSIQVAATIIIMILIERILLNIKTREYFLHSERLNVISELSASVSHEIRNPLTVTKGFLQLLNESKTLSWEERSYIDFSLQELKRAENIVNDYLALAKPQSENMVYTDLKEETEYVKNIMMPYAHLHKVEVYQTFTNTLKRMCDKNQVQQCLLNLYKNAIEAMQENGGVLTVTIYNQKQSIIIKIKDTGIGMTKEELSRLGRPYYSTKEEGTGMGMIMVYSTVNKTGGRVDVESVKGKGTTFTIILPV
ncbi:ATP-binding protein [Alteribacillus sp. HJP-4]|uniref:ATP-binding protein n=1 Tax=Alteribacillus sp. HJP-4 TaxID=2775394 RepID=UPI0035CCFCE3